MNFSRNRIALGDQVYINLDTVQVSTLSGSHSSTLDSMTSFVPNNTSRNSTNSRSVATFPQFSVEEIAVLTKPQILQLALQQSLQNGPFYDTIIWAFSRRRSDGVVDKPLSIHANSVVLRANSSHFDGFFNSGFSEAKLASLQESFPSDKDNCTSEYDYESDSDLEDDAEGVELEDVGETSHALDLNVVPANIAPVQGSGELRGRVLLIHDVAFTTMKAFIYYLYTGEVNFAPLRSYSLVPLVPTLVQNGPRIKVPRAPACSPKSMYRLADKYGVADLREKAMLDIKSSLRDENIVQELRSSFTSTYDQIRDIEVEYACERSRLPVILPTLLQWTKEISTGNISHSADALVTVFQRAVELLSIRMADVRNECATCGYRSLVTNTHDIFRWCAKCNNYRNPRPYMQ